MTTVTDSSHEFRPPSTLVEEIVRVLTERIVRGEFNPGARLIEEDLAREFHVSRPPIRESLRVLEQKGLVTIVPRKGARISEPTPGEIEDIYVCRSALTGTAARLAARNMTPAELARFGQIVAEMRKAAKSDDLERYFTLNVEFHDNVASASRNSHLVELLHVLGLQVLRLRHTSLSLPRRMQQSLRLHEELLKAFKQRDGEAAERLMRSLIDDASAALTAHFSKRNDADEIQPARRTG
jgi:DNA-binding GntR family transcriptional regulator